MGSKGIRRAARLVLVAGVAAASLFVLRDRGQAEDTAAAMNETATNYPPGFDEFAMAGLTPAPARTVRPPRVAESPVSFECALHTAVPVGEGPGSTTVVIGLIRHIHIRDDVIGERNHIDLSRLRPVARLAGNSYAYVRETFELVRKTYKP